ncbi:Bub1 [Anopheles sinensis]|uniref:Bub1 n=1 Tax=Anopheles sinensis TaxID=74873 RepID=A0A084WE57_ANOSI|nr:Bub1 [Anopheles sinensis]
MGGFSKTSTPVGSFRYLRKHESNLSNLGQNEDSMNSTVVESSFFQAGEHDEEAQRRRLEKALATIETHLARPFIDPFNSELCRAFLTKVDFPARGRDPSDEEHPYCLTHANLPKLVKGQTTNLGGTAYSVEKEVGRGSYGSVFRAVNTQTGAVVAIKYQKPANTWELYICTEVKKRLTNDIMLPGFMDICDAVIAPNASVLVSEFSQYGSLLDINNKIRTATTKVMHESLVMHFSCQILSIVEYLHACNIIHADIKPDNFLLMKIPSRDLEAPTIRLIDFGCAIDMNFFEPKRQFKKVIQTDGFTCIEMQEGRPWSFQTDLFCVAGTIHVMLFGEYMQIVKKYEWDIKQKLPRYLKKHVWTEVFQKLLNIKDIDHMPSLPKLRELINSEAYKMDSELTKHIRTLSNLLKSR